MKNIVKVTLDLSKLDIEMLSYCIESAIDIKQMNEQDKNTAKKILIQLSKYL